MPETIIAMHNVSFDYKGGTQALKAVSLSVAAGEFVAVAGRNGSGKTTLTRLTMALIKPVGGVIKVCEKDITSCCPADMARRIGYVFQNPDRQIFRNTVVAEVAYGPEQIGFTKAETVKAVAEALAMTGLTSLAEAYPRTLTRGQKQKVAIASALAMRPEVLILDEPTSGQDPWETQTLMKLLTELNGRGMTIILVTHDMELIAGYASRVVVLSEGRKVFDGLPSSLFGGDYNVAEWGLALPTAAFLARKLKVAGESPADLDGLVNSLYRKLRTGGECHA
ncbi:MAG TPA: ABC transporter ATP-binding protein [Methylomusa anaerophila]|uniref:Energy-coupling factor transporter ATP-binding protein EcfA2 n=1 Tax=Methylomusa anaerophila TaxID=1930071 RepID=A0A348AHH3_9FIRM|nr:ABC transporter ATP-binding protein [Methylomusa anaerophila]BBB90521.1 energy-coupling factor transporter ATP-binding protein EcfA2 [Methylomusa anaerophila]HML89839.1 ABC transporter ATP-binding protein [Methylomusa anaerophila]